MGEDEIPNIDLKETVHQGMQEAMETHYGLCQGASSKQRACQETLGRDSEYL